MRPVTAIHYDPRLMEDALFHAQRQAPCADSYKRESNRIYEISDPDERERLFDALNRAWFTRLELDRVIARSIEEQPLINRLIANCFVARATHGKEDGAELFVGTDDAITPRGRHTLRILIRPESLLRDEILTTFLRHELLHISDMLDPFFAYEPVLPATEGGPTYDALITNRYRVLWDVTIDGRMARRGWCDTGIGERDLGDFLAAFPMLGNGAGREIFQRFFDAAQPQHSELVAFALNPRAVATPRAEKVSAGTRCALCRFPTHAFEPAPECLAGEIVNAIQKDFPSWAPSQGLCLQCADLYRARNLSISAAKLLPGWEPCSTTVATRPNAVLAIDALRGER